MNVYLERKYWNLAGHADESQERALSYLDEIERLQDERADIENELNGLRAELRDRKRCEIRNIAHQLMLTSDRYTPEMALSIAEQRYDALVHAQLGEALPKIEWIERSVSDLDPSSKLATGVTVSDFLATVRLIHAHECGKIFTAHRATGEQQ